MTTPGDTTMVTKAEVLKLGGDGGARVDRRRAFETACIVMQLVTQPKLQRCWQVLQDDGFITNAVAVIDSTSRSVAPGLRTARCPGTGGDPIIGNKNTSAIGTLVEQSLANASAASTGTLGTDLDVGVRETYNWYFRAAIHPLW